MGSGGRTPASIHGIPGQCFATDTVCQAVNNALNGAVGEKCADEVCAGVTFALTKTTQDPECSGNSICTAVRTAVFKEVDPKSCHASSLCFSVKRALTAKANDPFCRGDANCLSFREAGFNFENLEKLGIIRD
jgi:hypothetical protein